MLSILDPIQITEVNAFVPSVVSSTLTRGASTASCKRRCSWKSTTRSVVVMRSQGNDPIFYNDFEGFGDDDSTSQKKRGEGDNSEDDDEDEVIDADALGDWRTVRQTLLTANRNKAPNATSQNLNSATISKQNQQVLASQSEQLAEEYKSSVWAHETATVSNRHSHAGILQKMHIFFCVLHSKLLILSLCLSFNYSARSGRTFSTHATRSRTAPQSPSFANR